MNVHISSSPITMSDLFSLEDIKSRLDPLDQEKKDLETEKKEMRDSLQKATTSENEKIIMERLNILNNRILAIENECSKVLDLQVKQGRFLVYV